MTLTLPPYETWQDEALCAHTGTADDWFPERGHSRTAQAALKICGHCPVRDLCRDTALARGEQWGIWGGIPERKRRRLLREAPSRRPECGTNRGYYMHRNNREVTCSRCLDAVREETQRRRAADGGLA